MTLYTGEVAFKESNFQTYQVDADDEDDAAVQMLSLAKEDFPDGENFSIDEIEKVVFTTEPTEGWRNATEVAEEVN